MKLLLDENLSWRMLADLEPAFPDSDQVRRLGLETASDRALWEYAREHGFTIVTQDSDFHELAALFGSPPKIVWLKCGNRPRRFLTDLLLRHRGELEAFAADADAIVAELMDG